MHNKTNAISHPKNRLAALMAVAAMGLGSSAQAQSGEDQETSDSLLSGTSWKLIAIESIAQTQASFQIEDPQAYQMRLGEDGQATMSLGCNNALGSWNATPGLKANVGNLSFGPLAMTRALCPPPRYDEHIALNVNAVERYLVNDTRLYFELPAQDSIWIWERTE